MSSRSKSNTPMQLVQQAYRNLRFIKIEVGDDGVPVATGNLSIGGTRNQWAPTDEYPQGRRFYYWPEFRLAGRSGSSLLSYAYDTGLWNPPKKGTTSPLIGRGEDNTPAAFAYDFELEGKGDNTRIAAGNAFLTEEPVYDYRITYSTEDDTETLTSTQKGEGMSAAEFVAAERGKKRSKTGTDTKKEEDLDALARYILTHKFVGTGDKTKPRGSKGKREATYENFFNAYNSQVKKKNAANKEAGVKSKEYFLDISKLNSSGSDAHTIYEGKMTGLYYQDPDDPRIVFKNNSYLSSDKKYLVESGPIKFYLLMYNNNLDKALSKLKSVIKAERTIQGDVSVRNLKPKVGKNKSRRESV